MHAHPSHHHAPPTACRAPRALPTDTCSDGASRAADAIMGVSIFADSETEEFSRFEQVRRLAERHAPPTDFGHQLSPVKFLLPPAIGGEDNLNDRRWGVHESHLV